MRFELQISGRKYAVDVERTHDTYVVIVEGRELLLEIESIDAEDIRMMIGGQPRRVQLLEETASGLVLAVDGEKFALEWPEALRQAGEGPRTKSLAEEGALLSPLPGVVTSVEVRLAQAVREGTPLVVIEAMKMESIIRSDRSGIMAEILVKKGESVRKGQPLVMFSNESG